MKSCIGSYSCQSLSATSVGWLTSCNIISGEQGKSKNVADPQYWDGLNGGNTASERTYYPSTIDRKAQNIYG